MKKEVRIILDLIRSRIREERKSQGISQGAMAEKLEVARPYYCQLESGTRQLSTRRLITIAKALNVKLDKLCKPRRGTVVVETEEATLHDETTRTDVTDVLEKAREKRKKDAIITGYTEPKRKTSTNRVGVVMQSQWTYHP